MSFLEVWILFVLARLVRADDVWVDDSDPSIMALQGTWMTSTVQGAYKDTLTLTRDAGAMSIYDFTGMFGWEISRGCR